jgi:thiol:disulfide interchange protein
MKSLKKVLATAMFAIVFTVGAYAQNSTKIIAVVKTASWCSVCKANETRAMAALNENNKDGAYQFVINDITSPETAKKSVAEIEKLGLTKLMEPYMATGVVYLFDAKTKKPINQLVMSLSSEDLGRAMDHFKKG